MYRVELKAKHRKQKPALFVVFLMYRVELKVYNWVEGIRRRVSS